MQISQCSLLFILIVILALGGRTSSKKTDDFSDEKPKSENSTKIKNGTGDGTRDGKIFSLFSIVTFKNTGCRSQSTLSSGQSAFRNGTCYTSSECSNKGGSASGNCAAGFGVCCLFIVSTSGQTITQNCTYIRNPNFPGVYSSTSAITYTINKCTADVCWLRLDFESFSILGPTVSTETQGGLCPDSFKVTTNTGQPVPNICGMNTGQHIYTDIGTQAGDSATLSFTFSGTSTTRIWEIKVTQVECSNPSRPPNGCLQNWSTLTGRITTFNFLQTASSSNLQNQDYSACIRLQNGYCCVQYQVCQNVPNAFTLDTNAVGKVDSQCTSLDYVLIEGANTICNSKNPALNSKFCGSYFGNPGTAINQPVCDCTAPFMVHFRTDNIPDPGAAAPNTIYSRGVCLDYMQIPC